MASNSRTETGRIIVVAIAADEQAVPTIPAKGTIFDWDADIDWDPIGFKFTEDDFAFNIHDDTSFDIKAPIDAQRQKIIHPAPPMVLSDIELTSYEVGEKVLDASSNWTETTGVYDPSTPITLQGVILEFEQLGWLYLPSCEILAGVAVGGHVTPGTENVRIIPTATDTVEYGYQWHAYT